MHGPSVPGEDITTTSKLKLSNQKLRTRLCRLRKKQAKKLGNSNTKKNVIKLVSQYVSGPALQFIKTQIHLSGRKNQGNRWSDEFKALALSLYHSSPKCYRML